jgi:hypothetical protein
MYKSILLAPALALALALPAHAVTDAKVKNPATRSPGLADEVVEVQTRPSPAGVIFRDMLGGAVVGAAVGGGVVLYKHYVTNNGNGDWGNWGRDIGIGAAIGAGAIHRPGARRRTPTTSSTVRSPISATSVSLRRPTRTPRASRQD